MGRRLYHGRDARDEPCYTCGDVAAFLRIPVSTVRVWCMGQPLRVPAASKDRSAALIRPASTAPAMLSFWNLVELYVLGSLRRKHGISLQKVRRSLRFVERELGVDRPLIRQEFYTDGVGLFVKNYTELLNVSQSGQLEWSQLLQGAVQRVERDVHGLASALFPWINRPEEPRDIEIDPLRAFGRPVVAKTGIPTESIAERFRAGESIQTIARDFGLNPNRVEAAVRWESHVPAA